MAPLKNTNIFPNSTRNTRARENAERASQILQKMQQALRYPTRQTTQQIEGLSRQLASAIRGTGGRIPIEHTLIRMAGTIERMAIAQQKSFVNQVLSSMGEPGSLIQSWLRSREGAHSLNPIKTEIQNVMDILGHFAGEWSENGKTPEQAGGNRLADWIAPKDPSSSAGKASGSSGSSGGGNSGGRPSNDYNAGPHPNVRVLPDGQWNIRAPGYNRTLQPDDPVLTGEMRQVKSSNVYAIGFDFNFDLPLKSKLIIRYKQKDRKGSGNGTVGGPTYEYQGIHPDWFADLLAAGSKGKWVWDQLRIRGTVAGHQYPYNLIRAAQGYLPRRAIVRNGRQEFRRRQRTAVDSSGREQVLVSPLANQILGRYSPTSHRPNVGNMDRGVVNRVMGRGR